MRNISSIRYNTPYEAVLIALVALWGLLYAVSPCNFDDFWFTPENWDGMGPWQKIAACFDLSFERCTHTDSGRFVNFTCAPFLAPPRWIFGIFMALCLWLTTRFMDWMAGCGYRSLRLWLILAAFVFILPWYDYMLSTIFALNYVWSSVIILSAYYFILRSVSGKSYGPVASAMIGLLCFVAGWAHEGLSIPLVCGTVLAFLILRKRPGKRMAIYLTCLCLGILMIVSSSLRRAAAGEFGYGRFAPFELAAHLAMSNLMAVVYALLLIVTAASARLRSRYRELSGTARFVAVSCAGAVAAGIAINFAVYVSPRTGWGVQLFGIIGSAALLPIFRFGFLKNRIVRFCVALTLAGAVLFNLTAALREQTELSREAREIVRIYTSGTDGVVFYDNIKPKLTPALY